MAERRRKLLYAALFVLALALLTRPTRAPTPAQGSVTINLIG